MTTPDLNIKKESAFTLLSAIWVTNESTRFIGSLENKKFKNNHVTNVDDAVKLALYLDSQGKDTYFALGSFENADSRESLNAIGVSAFWIDIDCGQEKYDKGAGYLNKKDADYALTKFCKETQLPQPTHLVDSGNGIHAYWALDKLIARDEWQVLARKLKSLTKEHGLIADPTRTADIASVLRIPSTYNHKDKANPKLVKLKYAKPNINADDFISALNSSNRAHVSITRKLGNSLETSSDKNVEPYPFEENKEDFYNALCAAYPHPSAREEWRIGICALAYLAVVMKWPESDVIKIRESWENRASNADKTENEQQWQDALLRTAEKVKANALITTHLTILKKARENRWLPKARITDALTAIQDKFALISLGGKVGIVDKETLEITSEDGMAGRLVVMTRMDGGLLIQRFLASEYYQVDSKGLLATFTRDKNTTLYSGVEFNPKYTTPNVLNLWIGETVKPKQGKYTFINTLLLEVLCGNRQSEYQYLKKYIAHALQRPWEKPGVMVILLGGQGIGKGTLAKLLQKIWSATFLQTNRIKQVVGDFNGSLERAFIVFLDEALFAGDRVSSDALKSLVTEATISINEKHQPTRQIKSYHRFFSATNSEHFKATDRDDRRDFVLRVSEHRKGDHPFWDALNAEIENGGVEAFAHDLLAMDLIGFNVRAKPNTRELTEQKLQSLDKFPRWWFDCLSQGLITNHLSEWPEFISSSNLLTLFKEYEKSSRVYKSLIERELVIFMGKMCPSAIRVQKMEGQFRRRGFTLPNLKVSRQEFEKYIGDSIEWEELECTP